MKYLLLAITLASLLCCCESGKRQDNTNAQVKVDNPDRKSSKDTIIVKRLTTLRFSLFWPAFRRAVMEQDTATILRLTHFPFETRGESDDDPVVRYEQADFLRLYPLLFSQPTGLNSEGEETELDLVRTTAKSDSLRPTEDFARLGALEFRKIDEHWKFAFAYLTDETIEKMKKK
ncbi:hypothetical protein GXP67_07160 [Rhodocytophaga rosea]|uniref:Uncharacterized protein n=1 Tax=Rhodocytophaga rosea TaxID=2704465 RepID=A0A6C0GFI8_9BACT|nr:hypothetical protein [Rhodocytophaga rosea]QHT66450.1 hypothetical protein GXP67_07160 [Rhodocytophaga rosea]